MTRITNLWVSVYSTSSGTVPMSYSRWVVTRGLFQSLCDEDLVFLGRILPLFISSLLWAPPQFIRGTEDPCRTQPLVKGGIIMSGAWYVKVVFSIAALRYTSRLQGGVRPRATISKSLRTHAR